MLLLPVLCLFTALCSALTAPQLLKQKEKTPGNLIKLTNSNFERILAGPRDAYIVVLLTATNQQVGCTVCQQIQPEFDKLADSWFSEHPDGDGLFFARADFAEGQSEVFKKFQLNNVPRLYLYSPTDEDLPFNIGFDGLNIPQSGVQFSHYISQGLAGAIGKDIHIVEPTEYGLMVMNTLVIAFAFWFMIRQRKLLVKILSSRPLWGGLIVFAILLFTTGYMFNAIRGTPYIRPGATGEIEYFVPGQQQQLGAETQIMSFVYAVLAFSAVSLVTKVRTIKDERVHVIVTVTLSALIFIFFGVLISIFKFKTPGYPFSLIEVWSP